MPCPPPANAKRVFHGEIMDFWQWDQIQFDGSTATFECVTRPDTVSVLCFIDQETVLLTKQEQPHKPLPFFDLPGGRVDSGEDQLVAAKRELLEETGTNAQTWLEWSRLKNNGVNRFEEVLFLARDAQTISEPHMDAGEKIETLHLPWKTLVDMCLKRQLRQPNTMLSILQMAFETEHQKRLADWLA